MRYAVIMAGGKGERFWPQSRLNKPKQFLSLLDGETMIQSTVRRISKIIPYEKIYIVTNESYRGLCMEQLPMLKGENILIEPVGRNTAACIGIACLYIDKLDKDATMVVLPSDHLIKDEEGFINTIEHGLRKAEEGENLITIGIKPNYPETGYGYIKCGSADNDLSYAVERFVEKPNLEKAREYLTAGSYLWNSGMFVWKVSTIMDNFKKYMPKFYYAILRMKAAINTDMEKEVIAEEFTKLDNISIDYGVLEKARNIFVIPCDFGWDDVGSWVSLERHNPIDEAGNVISGKVIHIDTRRCIVKSGKKLIATLGVEDLIVIDVDDVILICTKDKAQDIKRIINEIRESSMDYYL